MAARARSSSQKRLPKEKVVQYYESLFRGEDVQSMDASYWQEMFLLRPHVPALTDEIQRLSLEQLLALNGSLSVLFSRCVETICDAHMIRCVHALQTLSTLLLVLMQRFQLSQPPPTVDILSLMLSVETERSTEQQCDLQLTQLVEQCAELLLNIELPLQLHAVVLQLLLILAVFECHRSLDESRPLAVMMSDDGVLLTPLLHVLSHSAPRSALGHRCVQLLTLLLSWRKQHTHCRNPYAVRLSVLDNELALNGYSQVITAALVDFNNQHAARGAESAGSGGAKSGWLSSLGSVVGSVLGGGHESTDVRIASIPADNILANHCLLLALYEAVHLNRHFVSTLTQAATDANSQSSSPLNSLERGVSLTSVPGDPPPPSVNLLVCFIEFCSLVMQHSAALPCSVDSVRLCFTVLTCITEDQYCNTLLHDANLVFSVRIHRMPMRHRRSPAVPCSAQPLAVSLLDLCVEFVVSHLSRRFPVHLHAQCIGVVHRLLCHQKRQRIRLNYHWSQLWTALVALLRFIAANETSSCVGADSGDEHRLAMLRLAVLVANIFNLFITYGDTFLPTPACYDELYYELIRMSQVFTNVYAMTLRHMNEATTALGKHALQLSASLVNIRAICNHFNPKIELWLQANNQTSPSEQQVLDVVRDNYESLTLKLQDGLDQYTRFTETDCVSHFLSTVLAVVLRRTVSDLQPIKLDHAQLVSQLSLIQ